MCDFVVNSVVIWLAKKTASAWAYESWLDEPRQQQRMRNNFPTKAERAIRAYWNNNTGLRKFPSDRRDKIRNIFISFFAVPPSHTYILGHPKQLFFYNISSLNASFRRDSKLGYYLKVIQISEGIKTSFQWSFIFTKNILGVIIEE